MGLEGYEDGAEEAWWDGLEEGVGLEGERGGEGDAGVGEVEVGGCEGACEVES